MSERKEKVEKEPSKILILCVDRDDDIGVKAKVETPLVGRRKNFEAASQLAIADPEEADANAIFGAIRTYDTLSSEASEENYEIATIAGSEFGGVKADKKLVGELEEVLSQFPAEGVILVSDGFADETVIPIIQSHVPITSVKRIVVRHSEAIEETWFLFSRYFKKLAEDPRYSRIALGVPGVLLIALAILWYFGLLLYAGLAFLIIVGAVLFLKGFGIDKKISSISLPSPPGQIRLFTTVATLIVFGVDAYQTYLVVAPYVPGDPALWLGVLPRVIGLVMANATDLAVIALCTFLIGNAIAHFFTHNVRFWRNIIGVVVFIWLREIAYRSSVILLSSVPPTSIMDKPVIDLLVAVFLGVAVTVVTILITFSLSKRYQQYFKRAGAEEVE